MWSEDKNRVGNWVSTTLSSQHPSVQHTYYWRPRRDVNSAALFSSLKACLLISPARLARRLSELFSSSRIVFRKLISSLMRYHLETPWTSRSLWKVPRANFGRQLFCAVICKMEFHPPRASADSDTAALRGESHAVVAAPGNDSACYPNVAHQFMSQELLTRCSVNYGGAFRRSFQRQVLEALRHHFFVLIFVDTPVTRRQVSWQPLV